MKIGNLNQHCGGCGVIEYCGNAYGYCLCTDARLGDMEESEYKRIAKATDVKIYEACEGCIRSDCGPYRDSENDFEDEGCEFADESRDYYCRQVADYVWSSLAGGEER